jgi:hypothetical protein
MILVLILGGWLGWVVHRAKVQRDAVAAIRQVGGKAEYDWRWSDGRSFADGHPPGPRWLHARVGPEFLGEVTAVWLDAIKATDAVLSHVGQLRRLELLALSSASVSDAGLAHLAGLTRLERLDLSRSTASDAGLKYLAGLTRLEELNLGGTKISDAGLKHLAGLTRLKSLQLFDTEISDVGLKHLAGLTRLKSLSLHRTQVTDDGLKALQAALPGVKIGIQASRPGRPGSVDPTSPGP